MILALLIALAAPPAAAPPVSVPAAEQTEALAATASPTDAARLWATAGNQRLSAGDAAGAARAFDRVLALPGVTGRERGQALLDRARAAQAAGDLVNANWRSAEAARLIPKDPFLWYFRTVIAIAENDVPRAKIAIRRGLALAPGDPTLLFEAGHVARLAGEDAAAREAWGKALAADPGGPVGQRAREALGLAGVPLTVGGAK